jgi:hypothetical protein
MANGVHGLSSQSTSGRQKRKAEREREPSSDEDDCIDIESDEIIQIIDALLQELHDLPPEASDTDRQHIEDDLDLFALILIEVCC